MITKITGMKREHRRIGLYSVSLFILGMLSGVWLFIINLEMAGVPLNVTVKHEPFVPQQVFYRLDSNGLVSETIMENKRKQCDEDGNQQSVSACAVYDAYQSRHTVERLLLAGSSSQYALPLLEQMDAGANEYCSVITDDSRGGFARQLFVYSCATRWNTQYLDLLRKEEKPNGELLFNQ